MCPELNKLREDARDLSTSLVEKSRLAREKSNSGAHSDYELFLRRKLAIASFRIERHLDEHNCQ